MTFEKILDRCTGHCCEGFVIKGKIEGYDSDYWEHDYVKAWQDYGTGYLDCSEQALIFDMLIPVKRASDDAADSFTCKYFNVESRVCTIYAQRPTMCRKYPDSADNSECQYEECTLKRELTNAILRRK